MNTIYEATSTERKSFSKTTNNTTTTTTSYDSIVTSTTSTSSSSASQSVLSGANSSSSSSSGGTATSKNGTNSCVTTENGTTSKSTSTSASAADYAGELKIIGQLRNIERISEKRRFFSNSANYSSGGGGGVEYNNNNNCSDRNNDDLRRRNEEGNAAKAAVGANASAALINGGNAKFIATAEQPKTVVPSGSGINNRCIHETHFQQLRCAEELLDSSSTDPDSVSLSPKYVPLKSPPPKPPMLSRNRSNSGRAPSPYRSPYAQTITRSAMSSPIPSAMAQPSQPAAAATCDGAASALPPTTAVVSAAATPAAPSQAAVVELEDETPPVLRRAERPKSMTPDVAAPAAKQQISANHYERLIEELKCPGCAYPMKGHVLLCKTGHSICTQCTRVLLLCPLCKEPFTNIRSLTVEALCSKAHFRCSNAAGGCTVRLQIDLLNWHEKQCIYKPMKCFMGRVHGNCNWSGREAGWKEHLESEHADKVFTEPSVDLIWDMSVKQKPLTGYYVFEVFGEMFNFYEVHDKERVLFTMSCTSTVREKKLNYAFEVTVLHRDNEALAITQKFPVHSEYDKDILLDGTCVSICLADLAKFIDADKLLHYRVRVLEVKSPQKSKISRNSSPNAPVHPLDFQQTQIEGVNLKRVPVDVILTRKITDDHDGRRVLNGLEAAATSSSDEDFDIRRQYLKSKSRLPSRSAGGGCDSDSDPEFEAFIAKKWGTPQLHFNRKYLKNPSSESSSADDSSSQRKNQDVVGELDKKFHNDDKISLCSTNTSYKKKVANSLRKSFRSLKTDIIDLKPFGKKSSPEKNANKKSP